MWKVFYAALAVLSICLSRPVFAGDTGREALKEPAAQGPGEEAAPDSEKEAAKAVVARVNGSDITLRSVLDMMRQASARKERPAGTPEEREAAKKEALDRVVFLELVYQKAMADGMKASPEEVGIKEQDITARLGGAEALREYLEREKLTEEEFRAGIEKSILMNHIFAREVYDRVVISDDDISGEYEREKTRFAMPEFIMVTDVVFFLDPGDAGSVAHAEGILKKILDERDRNPYNFDSDGTFTVYDTELRKEKHGVLCDAARKLKTGELSGVIKTDDSLHIIKLKSYMPEKQFTLDEVKGKIRGRLEARARQKRLREWESELRKEAKIEIIETGESE